MLLHDATPLARYTGGLELLARLAVGARDAAESPHGLWLLCPMEDPQGFPLLDRHDGQRDPRRRRAVVRAGAASAVVTAMAGKG